MSEDDVIDVPETHSRRRFLRLLGIGGSAAVVAAAIPLSLHLLDDDAPDSDLDLLTATPDTFSPHVGERFTLADGRAEVTLTAVRPLGANSFSLGFESVSGAELGQDTYSFRRRGLGRFQMFIVPSKGTTPISYSAIINHEVA